MPVLGAILLVSLTARIAWLGAPCRNDCQGIRGHVLIFDEKYYVEAARVIAGIHPPPNNHYTAAPLGTDPNAEHPQLVKVVMAGAIEVFGDGPFAWRVLSLVTGTLVLLGIFFLLRSAGGDEWTAVAATAIMALDNLTLVASRIRILDIPALAAMVWAAVLYLRKRPVAAGALLGVGACAKEVALLGLLVLALTEVLQRGRIGRWRALLVCAATASAVFLGLLWLLDLVAPPFDAAHHKMLGQGPVAHVWHMLSYGTGLTSPGGPHGIASYPWAWLIDLRPIVYLSVDPATPSAGLVGVTPPVHFLGFISPPILLLGVPWLVVRLAGALRRRALEGLPALGLAWFLATWTPFALASAILQRTSYLYYMIIVMPGLAIACADALARAQPGFARKARLAWWAVLVAAAVLLYPLTPLP